MKPSLLVRDQVHGTGTLGGLGSERRAPGHVRYRAASASLPMGIVEHLTRLWTQPVPARAQAVRAFGELYTDPVSVNGTPMSLLDLVARARALQRAFADLTMEVIDEFQAPNRFVIVFLQRGRHVGPLSLPLGEIAPTGRQVEVRTIDVLSMTDDRISAVQVVPDNLGLAMQLDAVALRRAG